MLTDVENTPSIDLAYKILTAEQAARFSGAGAFEGAPIDLEDGYIHLSAADQVAQTAAKHFAGQDGLVLIALRVAAMGDALRWEPSRGGALFPHLYAPMTAAMVAWTAPMPLRDGAFALPDLATGAAQA